jgi:hypothetical protein
MRDGVVTPVSEDQGMQQSRSSRNLALTALGVVLIAIGLASLVGRPLVGAAFADPLGFGGAPWSGGAWHAGNAWQANALPAELSGLADVPANERFGHFRGVQVQLTDKDNRPVRVDVTAGTVTAISSTSLTIQGNDGAAHSYSLDDRTIQRGQAAKQNDRVVVATLDGSPTATAVFGFAGDGFGPRGSWGR